VFLDELSAGLTPAGLGPLLNRFAVPHVGNDKSGQDYSELGVLIPDGIADFSGRTESDSSIVAASDTAYISVTEEPIEEQDIAAYDTARLSVTDTAALFNFLAVTDTARISISETVALVSGTVVTKTASDTASISVTDTSALSVSVSATDTASISVGDVSDLVTALEQKSATDTASLTTEEDTLLGIFTGLLEITGSDIASLTLSESASVLEVRRIRRIALAISAPRITLEIN
jgi:hypothetical protein